MGAPGCPMENTAQRIEITRRQAKYFTNQIYSKVRLLYSESRLLLNGRSQAEVEWPSVKKARHWIKRKFPLKQWFSDFRRHKNNLEGL